MKISIYLASSLVTIGLILGIGFGYYLTPEYKTSMYEKNAMGLGQADRTFDLRYINSMIAHHRGAILLAEQIDKTTTRPELKELSQTILTEEPKAIAELYKWKKEWYKDTKTVRDPAIVKLGSTDETRDLRFLNAIIAHHEAGIEMTKETRIKSSRTEILNNVNMVEAFLISNLETLTRLRGI